MSEANGSNELISINAYEKVGLLQGMNVGDLGCGNLGYFSITAAKIIGKGGKVYAVDILRSALEAVANKARQAGLENIQTIWSNLEVVGATKIPESSLDVAFIHNVLFQSNKDDLVLKEAYRLIKTGGKLMVIDWLKIKTPFGPPMSDRIDKEEVKTLAKNAGFNLLEELSAGPYHYGLIFAK